MPGREKSQGSLVRLCSCFEQFPSPIVVCDFCGKGSGERPHGGDLLFKPFKADATRIAFRALPDGDLAV